MSRVRYSILACLTFVAAVSSCLADPIDLGKTTAIDNSWLIDGVIDQRYRTATTGRTDQTYTQAVELDAQRPIMVKGLSQGVVFIQGILESPPDQYPPANTMARLGESYISYRLPILQQTDSVVNVKIGQFPIALGLTPVYDSHLQIMQSLYDEAVGVRIDPGVAVEGQFQGLLNYEAALTTGVGPDRTDPNNTPIVSFRLGRLFSTDFGTVNIGGSMLSGTLPVTQVDPVTGFAPTLPESGYASAPYGYVNKTRIAGDAQWNYLNYTMRGEAMTGADNDTSVYGYFWEGEWRFAPGFSAVAARKYWNFGASNNQTQDNAIGLNISYGNNFAIRGLYEEQLNEPVDWPENQSHIRHVFTIQALARF